MASVEAIARAATTLVGVGAAALSHSPTGMIVAVSKVLSLPEVTIRLEHKRATADILRHLHRWAERNSVGDASLEMGIAAATKILHRYGLSARRCAELEWDAQAIYHEVVITSRLALEALPDLDVAKACNAALEEFYDVAIRQIPESTRTLHGVMEAVRGIHRVERDLTANSGLKITSTGIGRNSAPLQGRPIFGRPPRRALAFQRSELHDFRFGATTMLIGASGSGKTQLAAEQLRRSAQTCDFAFWVDAATETSVRIAYDSAYRSIIGHYEHSETPLRGGTTGDGHSDYADRFLEWLSRTQAKWMLVLDAVPVNCGGAYLELIPEPTETGSVAITTHDREINLGEKCSRVEVAGFRPDIAVKYLAERLRLAKAPVPPDSQLYELAAGLAWQPLALAQAASVIASQGCGVQEYVDDLSDPDLTLDELLPPVAGADSYPLTSVTATALSIRYAVQSNVADAASSVLGVLSLLGDTPVALSQLVRCIQAVHGDLGHAPPPSARNIRSCVAYLDRANLVTFHRQDALVTCHALVRRVIRELIKTTGEASVIALSIAKQFLHELEGCDQSTDGNNHASFAAWTLALFDSSLPEAALAKDDDVLALGIGVADYLGTTGGGIPVAISLLDRLLYCSCIYTGSESRGSLRISSELMRWISEQGATAVACRTLKRIYDLQSEMLGYANVETLRSLVEYGFALNLIGRSDDALRVLRSAYRDSAGALGSNAPLTLKCLGYLARAEADAHLYTRALRNNLRLTRARTRVLGPEHRDTLVARHNYVQVLGSLGKYSVAVALGRRLAATQERVLGPLAPDLLLNRMSIGLWTGLGGDWNGALEITTDALQLMMIVLGSDHPDTIKCRHNLAHATGFVVAPLAAVQLFDELVSDRERVLGETHPDSLRSRNRRAFWKVRAGRRSEAIAELEELQSVELAILGPNNWQYLATREELAAARGQTTSG